MKCVILVGMRLYCYSAVIINPLMISVEKEGSSEVSLRRVHHTVIMLLYISMFSYM